MNRAQRLEALQAARNAPPVIDPVAVAKSRLAGGAQTADLSRWLQSAMGLSMSAVDADAAIVAAQAQIAACNASSKVDLSNIRTQAQIDAANAALDSARGRHTTVEDRNVRGWR